MVLYVPILRQIFGHLKATDFPFWTNGKLMVLCVLKANTGIFGLGQMENNFFMCLNYKANIGTLKNH